MTSEPQPAASAHERAATAIIEYSQGQFVANEVHDIAELLREHFPAPAESLPDHIADAGKMVPAHAEPSVVSDAVPVPTVPGWYECRHRDATVERQVRWCEDGMSYPFHPRQSWQAGKVEYYTDFRRFVPAAEVEELRLALAEAIEVIRIFHGEEAWDLYEQSPEMKRFYAALHRHPSDLTE